MPFVEYHQRLYALREGENLVGGDAECDVRLPNLAPSARLQIRVVGDQAFVQDGSAGTRINGRPLDEPIRLSHQDRVDVGDTAILYVDEEADRKGSSADVRKDGAVGTGPEKGSAAAGQDGSGGSSRMVPVLIRMDDDHQVHVLDRSGLKIGREKHCDIVIPDRSVSRLHAELTIIGDRHVLHDLSRNGTLVNGEPADPQHLLRVGDVVQVGKYEFEFTKRPASVAGTRDDVTPVRSAMPDAPTVQVARKSDSAGGSPVLRWILILAVAAVAAAILLSL